MAGTPHFNAADDDGWWAGDYGERICTLTYDADSREIAVALRANRKEDSATRGADRR